MEEILNNIIKEHFGLSIFIICVVIIGIICLTWWCSRIYAKVKKIDDLPCDKHGERMDSHIKDHVQVETNIVKLFTSLEYIQKSIDNLSQSIQRNNKGIITDSFVQTQSPLSITPLGKEMIDRLGVEQMIDDNWDNIRLLISSNAESMNPYDIQEFCVQQAVVFPEKFLLPDALDRIKLDAYKTGNNLTSYMRAVAVLCRDRYFEENDINVSEVDKNDPHFQQLKE